MYCSKTPKIFSYPRKINLHIQDETETKTEEARCFSVKTGFLLRFSKITYKFSRNVFFKRTLYSREITECF